MPKGDYDQNDDHLLLLDMEEHKEIWLVEPFVTYKHYLNHEAI